MPRDYKSRANSQRKKKRQPVPGWVWFLAGLLVGLFFSGLAWLKLEPPPTGDREEPVSQRVSPESKPAPAVKREKEPPRPRFDFYTILPEMEVVVPDPEPEPARVATVEPSRRPQSAQQKSGGSGSYMLQMGSFRKYADADRLKASLALVGIRAEIQKVKINSKDTFHRVRAGPYTREKVNVLRARLKENSISSLVIKLKQ